MAEPNAPKFCVGLHIRPVARRGVGHRGSTLSEKKKEEKNEKMKRREKRKKEGKRG